MPDRTPPRPARRRTRPLLDPLEPRTLLTTIDVMVVYDTDALVKFNNSEPGIQKAIRQSLDAANLAHQNTADNVVLRLVYTGLINYSNAGAAQSAQLTALKANATVAGLRNTYGADLVSMVVNSAEGGGLGDLLTNPSGSATQAFSVVGYESVEPGSFVLAHEMGHNMGGGHEKDNATQFSTGAFPAYSFGYHTNYAGPSIHGTDYGDVMSYQGATLPVFSTPNYTHDGVALGRPIGDAKAADLQSTFLATAPNVANYRPTAAIVPDAAPAATLYQTDVVGNQLTFQVRYTDDIAVNVASLDDNDAYVATPEGFHLQARFVGADVAGNGYARTATYRVTLPANLPAVSSLGFFLNAGQAKDTNNAAVPAGQLAADVDGDLDRGFGAFQLARDTGALVAGDTRQLTGRVGDVNDFQDVHKLTVTANMNLAVTASGLGGALTSDPVLFVYRDANLNEVVDSGETVGNSSQTGTADKTMSVALTPGTYYVYLQLTAGHAATNYTLTLATGSTAVDTAPPTGTVDAVDVTAATNTLNFAVIYSDDQAINTASIGGATIDFNGGGWSGGGYTPTSVTVLDARRVSATYSISVPSNFSNTGTVTIKVRTGSSATDAAGNAIVAGATLGTVALAVGQSDATNPTASVFSAPPIKVPNGTLPATYDFVVAYKDNRGLNLSTLATGNVTVTGPAGSGLSGAFATFVNATFSSAGGFTYATYRVTAPGGSWDYTDDGGYTLAVAANQVKDAATRAVTAGVIGAFTVDIPLPGDADGDHAVGLNDLLSLSNHYGQAGAGFADGDFDYDGFVGLNDLLALSNHYGTSIPDTGAPDAPATADADAPAPLASTSAPAAATPASSTTTTTSSAVTTTDAQKAIPTLTVAVATAKPATSAVISAQPRPPAKPPAAAAERPWATPPFSTARVARASRPLKRR